MTTEQLKACAHCEGLPLQASDTGLDYDHDTIVCDDCGATAPTAEAWNRRTPVQLSAQTAEPYGYVLKTGHGTAFRDTLAGVEPDFVKHWVPLYTHPTKTEQPSLSDADLLRICHRHAGGYSSDELRIAQFNNDDLLKLAHALLAQRQDSDNEPLVWESITPCYTRFISEARYQKFSPGVRAWYRPVCEKCGGVANGAPK